MAFNGIQWHSKSFCEILIVDVRGEKPFSQAQLSFTWSTWSQCQCVEGPVAVGGGNNRALCCILVPYANPHSVHARGFA